jgi:hypothetical protein
MEALHANTPTANNFLKLCIKPSVDDRDKKTGRQIGDNQHEPTLTRILQQNATERHWVCVKHMPCPPRTYPVTPERLTP